MKSVPADGTRYAKVLDGTCDIFGNLAIMATGEVAVDHGFASPPFGGFAGSYWHNRIFGCFLPQLP
jgi:hypothetical protein